MKIAEMVESLAPGLDKLNAAVEGLLRTQVAGEAAGRRQRLIDQGAPTEDRPAHRPAVRAQRRGRDRGPGRKLGVDEIQVTRAYTKLGEALGLDWAQGAANRFAARDQWERLLTAGLARDFEQLRLDFLQRKRSDPLEAVDKWVEAQGARIEQFRRVVERAGNAPVTTAAMLAQIATQARVLLGR